MARAGRAASALVAAAVVLTFMAWFDTTAIRDAAQQAAQDFDSRPYAIVASIGTLMTGGSVLLLAVLAWRSRSVPVGVIYALVGGYFVFQAPIWMNLASASSDGSQAPLPGPLINVVNSLAMASVGQLNAVGVIGAGMLVAGVAVIASRLRERTGSPAGRS
jgi:hypothetical protein